VVLTRDPVADRIGAVVVAACTRNRRGLQSELALDASDGMPEPCVASFDNLHTVSKEQFRRRITVLPAHRQRELCEVLDAALGCVPRLR
jgi:mRNA interferase MazF